MKLSAIKVDLALSEQGDWGGTKLTYAYLSVDRVAVTMTLRVYDV